MVCVPRPQTSSRIALLAIAYTSTCSLAGPARMRRFCRPSVTVSVVAVMLLLFAAVFVYYHRHFARDGFYSLHFVQASHQSSHQSNTSGIMETLDTPSPSRYTPSLATQGHHDQSPLEENNYQPLVWTSLQNGTDKDTNFLSAYFDQREAVPDRPAVLVFGYHMKSLGAIVFYCKFTYASHRTTCLAEPVKQTKSCSGHFDGAKPAHSFSYVCKMSCLAAKCSEQEIPISVAISKTSDCSGASAEIPVLNRLPPRVSNLKTFGICVQGPFYGSSIDIQQISEYIEMNKVLGAEIITLYVREMKEDMWNFLQEHYVKQGLLQLYVWKKLEKWNLLHYFGQSLIMHDCLYRNMHRVKYLAIADLDELLLPMKHSNWSDLFDSLDNKEDYHSFRFIQCFYQRNQHETSAIPPPCKQMNPFKFFQWTSRLNCMCDDKYIDHRPKYMVRPELLYDLYIHWICKATRGKEYIWPHTVALNAHYRDAVPSDCANHRDSTRDTTALKHQSTVMKAVGEQLCPSNL